MIGKAQVKSVKKGWILCLGAAALAVMVSGCQGLNFYRQAIAGQYQILAHQEPIQKLIASPSTSAELKKKFDQVLEIRRFAASELQLPVDGTYLKYVDLHRPFVVWNVSAAPKLSLEPKTWWFPVVGSASYRGYFSKEAAQSYARKLSDKGLDVYVGGVETYSTLGWFRDPLLNTFIDEPEADLAELLFHELAHRRLYVSGDTDFNEAFATSVAEEGLHRWFLATQKPEAYARYCQEVKETEHFVKLIETTREQLAAVYEDPHLSDAAKLERKEQIIAGLRQAHEKMKAEMGGKSGYDGWFAGTINNAKLNTVSTYYELVPAFRELLRENGGSLPRFFNAVAKLKELCQPDRDAAMKKLLKRAQNQASSAPTP